MPLPRAEAPVSTEDLVVIDLEAYQFGYDPEVIRVKQGQTVRIEATSRDVDHSFAISELGLEERIMPGKTEVIEFVASEKGEFEYRCSVYCGPEHADMRGLLIVE